MHHLLDQRSLVRRVSLATYAHKPWATDACGHERQCLCVCLTCRKRSSFFGFQEPRSPRHPGHSNIGLLHNRTPGASHLRPQCMRRPPLHTHPPPMASVCPVPSRKFPGPPRSLHHAGVVAALHSDPDAGIDPLAQRVTLALHAALSTNASLAVLEQRYLTAAALLASPAGGSGSGWGQEGLAPSLRSGQCHTLLHSICMAPATR